MTRSLTEKEKKVIAIFEAKQPGFGEKAKRNILDPSSGWAETVADMDDGNLEALENIRRGSFWLKDLQ